MAIVLCQIFFEICCFSVFIFTLCDIYKQKDHLKRWSVTLLAYTELFYHFCGNANITARHISSNNGTVFCKIGRCKNIKDFFNLFLFCRGVHPRIYNNILIKDMWFDYSGCFIDDMFKYNLFITAICNP